MWKTQSLLEHHRPAVVMDALAKNEDLYYFGVGSNLLRSKIEGRDVGGSKIYILSMEPAVVQNYRLAFNFAIFPPLEPSMGSLEPCGEGYIDEEQSGVEESFISEPLVQYKEKECHGSLVRLTAEDYAKLMRSEGVGADTYGRKPGYEEIVVTAIPYDTQKAPVRAISLRTREHVRLKRDVAPSLRYMTLLRQGGQELGLRECYQQFLMDHPVARVSTVTRKVAICNWVFITGFLLFSLKVPYLADLQSWFLWKVYVPPTPHNKPLRILSEIATTTILIPGASVGFFLMYALRATNKLPPMVKVLLDSHW